MKLPLYICLSLMLSCNGQERDFPEEFENNKNDYQEFALFLKENEEVIRQSKCSVDNSAGFDMNEVEIKNCFPSIKAELVHFYSKKLFQTVEFYQDKSIEILLAVERNNVMDHEIEHLYIYAYTDDLPIIYRNYKIKKLDSNWWYVRKNNAYY